MNQLWRRRKVAFGSVLVVIVMVAAACGDSTPAESDSTDTTSTTAAPTTSIATTTTENPNNKAYGGEAVVADDQEPPTLNPFVQGGDNFIVSIIGQGYHAGVQEIDGYTLELLPELVTELPTVPNGGVTVNEDGTMTVSYTIRDEAVWSDGTPISGADFQFTLDTIVDPALKIDKTTYEDITDSSFESKSFTYTLAAPTTLYELIFGTIIPKHAVQASDFLTDWNTTMWPSAGPFVFDEWQSGEFIKLVRNDNYWKSDAETGQALPYLDTVIFRFIPETSSIISAFAAREIDIIQPPPASQTIETLQNLESEGARVEVLSGPVWEHLNFQFGPGRTDRNPTSANESLNYRKAVAHAIDKTLIVDEILAGQVEPLDSFVEAYSPTISQSSWAQYDYNVEKSKEFVAAAKAELGVDEISTVFSTTANNDARVQLSQLFLDMFSDVGIVYENMLEDSLLFFGDTLNNGDWDLGEWAWVGSPGLAGLIGSFDLFDPEAPPPDGGNYYRWGTEDSVVINDNTARFAEIRDELNMSVDEAVLTSLIQEGESIIAEELVIIPLYARLVTAAVWGDEIGGFKHNPTQASHTWNMEEWHRVDR